MINRFIDFAQLFRLLSFCIKLSKLKETSKTIEVGTFENFNYVDSLSQSIPDDPSYYRMNHDILMKPMKSNKDV